MQMCVIIELKPNQVMDLPALTKACVNNPHGYGLVVKSDGKLDVTKDFNALGNNPEDIQDILDLYQENHRFLHLRYSTAGSLGESNLHPFTVFNKGGHRIEMMHNGTLFQYKENGSDVSDTSNFANTFVKPLLEAIDGRIDLPIFETIIKEFTRNSKLVFISNKYPDVFVGSWDERVFCGHKVAVSNDDYFDVIRVSSTGTRTYVNNVTNHPSNTVNNTGNNFKGYSQVAASTQSNSVVPISSLNLHEKKDYTKTLVEEIMADNEFLQEEADLVDLAWIQREDLEKFTKSNYKQAAVLIEALASYVYDLSKERDVLIDKNEKATKYIASLKQDGKAA